MVVIDLRLLLMTQAISYLLCMGVLIVLRSQQRRRYGHSGADFPLIYFAMQVVAWVLLALRGTIPDWLSVLVANTLVIGGALLFYLGLERFAGEHSSLLAPATFLLAYVLIHSYFTFVHDSLRARNINTSAALLLLSCACVWLVWHRVDSGLRPVMRWTALIFVGYGLGSVFRIVNNVLGAPEGTFLDQQTVSSSLLALGHQALVLALTFSLTVMIDRRLFARVEVQQAALRDSELKHRMLTESTSDVIWVLDVGTLRFTYVSPSIKWLTGYSADEMMAQPFDGVFTVEGTAQLKQWIETRAVRFLEDERDAAAHFYTDELEQPRKDGATVWTEMITRFVRNPSSGHVEIHGASRDISERKKAEAVIHLRLQLVDFAAGHSLKELMQHALDGVCALTQSLVGFYHFVEPEQDAFKLQAWSTRTVMEFCHAKGVDMHYSIDEAGVWGDCVRQRKPIIHNDYAALSHRKGLPPGHAQITRELVVPAFADKQIVAVLGVGNKPVDYTERDVELVTYVADVIWGIIDRKRAEEQLRDYQRQLEAQNLDLQRFAEQLIAQNAELDAFAHTVAHDLKNPLASVIGYAKVVVEDFGDELPLMARQAAGGIVRSGEKLGLIIDELLLLSSVRSQMVHPHPISMDEVVEEVRQRLDFTIKQMDAQLIIPDPTAWPAVLGYAPWVEEVWANYIGNALKYGGSPPHIELGYSVPNSGAFLHSDSRYPAPGDPYSVPSIRFWVRDNGEGLSPEAQSKLFTPFTRLGQVRALGQGLGLSIVRRIVEKLGGEVGVESTVGRGSTFWFTLPAPQQPQAPLRGTLAQDQPMGASLQQIGRHSEEPAMAASPPRSVTHIQAEGPPGAQVTHLVLQRELSEGKLW